MQVTLVFNFTHFITGIIRNGSKAVKADLICEVDRASADHAAIVCEVAI